MAQPQVLEGQWEEIVSHNAADLAGRHVRIYVDPETSKTGETLEAALYRLNSRTHEQIAEARKRILDASREPLPLPEGQTLTDVIVGHWPGDETDEIIFEALRKLS